MRFPFLKTSYCDRQTATVDLPRAWRQCAKRNIWWFLKIIFWDFFESFFRQAPETGISGLQSFTHLGTVPATPEALHLIREAGDSQHAMWRSPSSMGFIWLLATRTMPPSFYWVPKFDPLPFHVGQMSVFVSGKYHDWFVHAIYSAAIPSFCWVYRCIAIFSRLNQSFCCVKPGRTRQPQRSASCFGHFQLCRGVFFFVSFGPFPWEKWGFTWFNYQHNNFYKKKPHQFGRVNWSAFEKKV